MKKFLVKLCTIISVFAVMTTFLLSPILAMTPVFGSKLPSGVGNLYYYVDGSASQYTGYVRNSANNWMYTGYGANPIYAYESSNNMRHHQ